MSGTADPFRASGPGAPGGAAIAAATVILIRDGAGGLETLMLRRNSRLAFGGMWVFPGGRVDPGDRTGIDPDELEAARHAAVREAREETGLIVPPDAALPYSHWSPPAIAPKRFLTWFFICEAPPGSISIDRGEIHEHAWMRPADALSRRDAGAIELAPPTWVTLHELTAWSRCGDALRAVARRTPERFVTRVASKGSVVLWHGDAGYEDGDAERPGPRHRLWMDEPWRYERTVGRGG
jgi:8-oxo-dGTP pyrophosphatase MutT (NUDIX family)